MSWSSALASFEANLPFDTGPTVYVATDVINEVRVVCAIVSFQVTVLPKSSRGCWVRETTCFWVQVEAAHALELLYIARL